MSKMKFENFKIVQFIFLALMGVILVAFGSIGAAVYVDVATDNFFLGLMAMFGVTWVGSSGAGLIADFLKRKKD